MRVLVTGSRSYTNKRALFLALNDIYDATEDDPQLLTVVHGACGQGADRFAAQWCHTASALLGYDPEEAHPADWRPNGVYDPMAGYTRNAAMIALGADVCLAFIGPCTKRGCPQAPHDSHGTTHTIGLARQASIEVREFRS